MKYDQHTNHRDGRGGEEMNWTAAECAPDVPVWQVVVLLIVVIAIGCWVKP